MYASEAKKLKFLVHLDHLIFQNFSNILNTLRNGLDLSILLKLQIKIGVHLINVEPSQLLTLPVGHISNM